MLNDMCITSSLEALTLILSAVCSVVTCQGGEAVGNGNVFFSESHERSQHNEMLGCLTAGALLLSAASFDLNY